MSIQHLINTSVIDAKITLENRVQRDPVDAARTAIALLEQLQGMDGQASRRKMAASIVRKATKALEGNE